MAPDTTHQQPPLTLPPSNTPATPPTLRIISLNCWGLKYISAHRSARLQEIGRQLSLAHPAPDIVGLQECWTQADYLSIRALTQETLPYGKFYHSGIFGGGLAILSRFPIVESSMHAYPLNGRPTAFFRGDWFVGKGVACATLRIGPGERDLADVLCTHLHAPYEREPNDSYLCHRTAQAWEIAKLMRASAQRGRLVVALGDFNMIPLSLAHRLVSTYGAARDVWREVHPDSSIGAAEDSAERARGRPVPSVEYNLRENGTTCDSEACTWRWNKGRQKALGKGVGLEVDLTQEDVRGKRLDYIFIGGGDGDGNGARGRWDVQDVAVGMMMRHPTLHCSLSDHFSVEATLTHSTTPSAHPARPRHLPLSIIDEILHMTHLYTLRERRQRRLRLGHFLGSIVVSVGCLVAVWWSPRNFVAFILMLVSTLNLTAGVLDGLIGGLFVGAEMRALKEFEWEVRNARVLAVEAESGERKAT